MKKLLIIIITLLVISSCSTTKEAKSSRIEVRKEKKLAEQEIIRRSVESRRFIVKLDRIYSQGGMIELMPRKNYIIIDGQKAIISAAYIGRQYNVIPVSGIRISGEAMNYELVSDSLKGTYKIKLKVNNSVNIVSIFLTIDKSGKCNASLTNLRINNILYKGYVVPIKDKISDSSQNSISI